MGKNGTDNEFYFDLNYKLCHDCRICCDIIKKKLFCYYMYLAEKYGVDVIYLHCHEAIDFQTILLN